MRAWIIRWLHGVLADLFAPVLILSGFSDVVSGRRRIIGG